MAKRIEINGSPEMADILVDAMKIYARMAFPDSGSPCQMVSRDALMNAADELHDSYRKTGTGDISSRMRVMLKAAIKNYFSIQEQQTGISTHQQYQLFLNLCRGIAQTQDDLLAARVADQGAGNTGT